MNALSNLTRCTTRRLQQHCTTTTTTTSPITTNTAIAITRRSIVHHTPTLQSPDWHGTTIVCVRKNGRVCMMGDGMVSMGSTIVKPNAKKIRRIMPKTSSSSGKDDGSKDDSKDEGTIVGFAGTTADAFTLLERLESKLDEYPGQLARSCVELAKGWRTDKYLRRLEASLLVADKKALFEITGNGDVLESHDDVSYLFLTMVLPEILFRMDTYIENSHHYQIIIYKSLSNHFL